MHPPKLKLEARILALTLAATGSGGGLQGRMIRIVIFGMLVSMLSGYQNVRSSYGSRRVMHLLRITLDISVYFLRRVRPRILRRMQRLKMRRRRRRRNMRINTLCVSPTRQDSSRALRVRGIHALLGLVFRKRKLVRMYGAMKTWCGGNERRPGLMPMILWLRWRRAFHNLGKPIETAENGMMRGRRNSFL
jgi:hypothetical protein